MTAARDKINDNFDHLDDKIKKIDIEIKISILRRENPDAKSYWRSFLYTPKDGAETVATALSRLNEREDLRDMDGNPAPLIQWEYGCLQKKCGACAMVINNRPALACGTRLYSEKDYKNYIKNQRAIEIRLEPLRKFPVIADLISDRSVLYENLKTARAWLKNDNINKFNHAAGIDKNMKTARKETDAAYEASRCLQCGCCLEVCPNFDPFNQFFGMSAAVPMSRILIRESGEAGRELSGNYEKYIYNGCGKSLACRNICPAGIDMENLLSRSAAIAVWRRMIKRK